jgi:hypothetical protein
MAFKVQPIMCRLSLNLTEQVENQKCTGILWRRNILCYYEPLSKSKSKPPVTNVNWTQLDVFINDETYPPSNWKDKGGYILDVRLLNTGAKLVSCETFCLFEFSINPNNKLFFSIFEYNLPIKRNKLWVNVSKFTSKLTLFSINSIQKEGYFCSIYMRILCRF